MPRGMACVPEHTWTNAVLSLRGGNTRRNAYAETPVWFVTEFLNPISSFEYTTAENAAVLFADALGALRSVHEAGVVHGDLALSHMGRDANGNLKLLDFGSYGTTREVPSFLHFARPEYMSVARQSSSSGTILHAADDVEGVIYVLVAAHLNKFMHCAHDKLTWAYNGHTDKTMSPFERELSARCKECIYAGRGTSLSPHLYTALRLR